MTQHDKKQDPLLVLLIDNMKEMETELRAHSIVLEALSLGVIGAQEMEHALLLARGSDAMLSFVEGKYAMINELCSTVQTTGATHGAAIWPGGREFSKLPN